MPGFAIIQQGSGCHDKDAVNDTAALQLSSNRINPANTGETLRQHRFSVIIYSLNGNSQTNNKELSAYVYKCTRPVSESDVITIHYGQQEIYRPGKHRWQPVNITFYEAIDNIPNSPAQYFYDWWGGVVNVGGMVNIETGLHTRPSQYHKTVDIEMLNGVGRPLWRHRLLMAWPATVSPSELDYSSSNIAEITVTLRYNRAIKLDTILPQ